MLDEDAFFNQLFDGVFHRGLPDGGAGTREDVAR